MRNVKFIEIRSELGAGTRGASLGIDAIKMAALTKKSDIFLTNTSESVESLNEWLYRPIRYPFARKIDAIIMMYERIAEKVRITMEAGYFPFVIAGDHANAGGTIAGIKKTYPNKRLGVIWIDAHADIHSPYTTPSGNLHGMPLAASLNVNNLESRINDIDEETKERWEKLCNVGGIAPKIHFDDLVIIGMRSLEQPEWDLIKKENIDYFDPEDIAERGIEKVALETLSYLDHCDMIYVSFDVDSMDPSVSSGTGTPEKGGLRKEEAIELLNLFWKSEKLCALEIVEVNPLLDTNNVMAETVVEIIQELVKK